MLLPTTLPGNLSISGAVGALFNLSGFRWHYAINGLPFLSGASKQNPIVRETAPIRKQQFDNSASPGEQSLDMWWLRSQLSFHGGAGQAYLDPSANDPASLRFHSSRNVDVWTQGKVTLLPAVKTATTDPIPGVVDATEITFPDGTNAAFAVTADACHVITTDGVVVSTPWVDLYLLTPTPALQSVTTDGAYVYVATSHYMVGAPIPATPTTPWVWMGQYSWDPPYPDVPENAFRVHMAYVKSRVMLGLSADVGYTYTGARVYELAPYPKTPEIDGGMVSPLPPPKYTAPPDTGFQWTGFTEMANAIYAVGNNGVRGSIIRFTLDASGLVPHLDGGAVAAQLPSGEVVYSALGYMGAFMGIGTNKGVRIAAADANGDLTYGPLLFSTSAPVRGWSARDRWLYCAVTAGVDGDSGVYRIDLSTQVSDLRFAYATDLNVAGDDSTCNVVAHLGSSDLVMFGTETNTYVTDVSKLAQTGYLRTSRIRFGTLEPKIFRQIRTRGPVLQGPLSVQLMDQYDDTGSAYLHAGGTSPGDLDVVITSPNSPQDFVSVVFTLGRDAFTPHIGAEMWGYQLKALPGTKRQRNIQVPLLCFDWERDSVGSRRGGEGSAMKRLFALEGVETTGNVIMFQDFTTGEIAPATIEQCRFLQSAPPSGFAGFGGLILLTVRTI